jgi:orotate phosphoribosyltransferase
MDEQHLKEELFKLLKEKSLMKGEMTLASGKKSNFYFDGKQVTLSAEGLFVMGKLILAMIAGQKVDAVGGPTLGADPMAAAVSLLSSQSGHPVRAFIVRKEAKKHGLQKMIEGPALKPGDRVVMLEDVITTGGSVLKAIEEVEKVGAKVVKTICLVDRGEGAEKILEAYHYSPIFSIKDFSV